MTRTQRPSPRSKHTRPRTATPPPSPSRHPSKKPPPLDLAKLDRSLAALREETARTMAFARLAARAVKSIEAAQEQAERTYRDARRLHDRIRRLHPRAS